MRLVAGFALGLLACSAEPGFAPDAGVSAALGAAYVRERGCATCHDGDPGTPQAGAFAGQDQPRPGTSSFGGNLTPDPDTGLGNWADVQIIRALRAGVDADEQPLCPPMTHYTDMGDLEAQAIVAYLRSLPAVYHQSPESSCPPLKSAPPADGGGR